MLGDTFGVSAKNENLIRTLLPSYGKIDRIVTDVGKGQGVKRLASEFGGIRIVPVDEQRIARSKLFQKQSVLRRVKKKLRDEGIIPANSTGKVSSISGSRKGRGGRSGRKGREGR